MATRLIVYILILVMILIVPVALVPFAVGTDAWPVIGRVVTYTFANAADPLLIILALSPTLRRWYGELWAESSDISLVDTDYELAS